MKVCIPIIMLFLCIFLFGCQKDNDVIISRQDDLQYLSENLKSKHINAFHSISEQQFNDQVTELRNEIPHLSEQQYYVKLMELIASIGDAHTQMQRVAADLPISFHEFEDKVYIVGANRKYSALLGKKVTKINGLGIEEVKESFRKIISYENEFWLSVMFTEYLKDINILKGLGIITSNTDHVTLTVADEDNKELECKIRLDSKNDKDDKDYVNLFDFLKSPPLFYMHPDKPYWFQYIDNQKTMYFQYNTCSNDVNNDLNETISKMMQEYNQNDSLEFVLDLRFNTGGDSRLIDPLIDALQSNMKEKGKKKIYVLIDHKTFSSAVYNAIDFKNKVGAILVGQPTGGKPNCYGDILSIVLPHSQFKVFYSTQFFSLVKDNNQMALFPDIYIDWKFNEFQKGIDPYLDYCLQNYK